MNAAWSAPPTMRYPVTASARSRSVATTTPTALVFSASVQVASVLKVGGLFAVLVNTAVIGSVVAAGPKPRLFTARTWKV